MFLENIKKMETSQLEETAEQLGKIKMETKEMIERMENELIVIGMTLEPIHILVATLKTLVSLRIVDKKDWIKELKLCMKNILECFTDKKDDTKCDRVVLGLFTDCIASLYNDSKWEIENDERNIRMIKNNLKITEEELEAITKELTSRTKTKNNKKRMADKSKG